MHFSAVRSHATGDVSAPRKSGFPLAGASANGLRRRRWRTNGLRVFYFFSVKCFLLFSKLIDYVRAKVMPNFSIF